MNALLSVYSQRAPVLSVWCCASHTSDTASFRIKATTTRLPPPLSVPGCCGLLVFAMWTVLWSCDMGSQVTLEISLLSMEATIVAHRNKLFDFWSSSSSFSFNRDYNIMRVFAIVQLFKKQTNSPTWYSWSINILLLQWNSCYVFIRMTIPWYS